MATLVVRLAVAVPPAETLWMIFVFARLCGVAGVIPGQPLTGATWLMVKRMWIEGDNPAAGEEASASGATMLRRVRRETRGLS